MQKVFAALDRCVELAIFVLFLAIVLVGTAQVVNRYGFNASLSWSEEFQRYGQIWIVFLGIPVAYRRGMHIGMDLLEQRMENKGRQIFSIVVDLLWLFLAGAIVAGLLRLMPLLQFQRSPGLGLPMHWVYSGILIGAVYTIIVALRRIGANLAGRGFGHDPMVE